MNKPIQKVSSTKSVVTKKYSPENLAYWYFRLNGFLTTENFIIHPDDGRDQGTDADILAVRFKHRAENLISPMADDPRVIACPSFVNVVIAEIKTKDCFLNESWTNPSKQNMKRVLRAIGCIDKQIGRLLEVANSLYNDGIWQTETVSIRLFAVGETKAQLIIPEHQQITWDDIIQFTIKRFKDYKLQKSSVGQWRADGKHLKSLALKNNEAGIRQLFGLNKK